MQSYLNNHTVRGIRNNNPGNLRRSSNAWLGKIPYPQSKDAFFEQFITMAHGVRAFYRDIINDIDKGQNTVRKLITAYAPPNENNTQAYIDSICKALNVNPNEIIKSVNSEFLKKFARAVFEIENGKKVASLVTETHLNEAFKILGSFNTKNIVVSKSSSYLPNIFLVIVVFFYTYFTVTI